MPKEADKYAVLIITSISSFVSSSMFSSVNVALPIIGREFEAEAVLLGWVVTAFSLITGALQIPMGRLADIKGRKRTFLFGTVILAVTSFLCAVAGSPLLLILFRFLQGIGAAMVFTNAVAIITSAFPPQERGRAIGVNAAAVYAGLSAGPLIGGLLTEQLGWRSIFHLNGILNLIVIILILWRLKGEWSDAKAGKFDWGGALIYAISIMLVMYGFTIVTTIPGMLVNLLGLAGIWAFAKWEGKITSPIIHLSLFRKNPVFVISNSIVLIQYSSVMALTFFLSLHLQYVMGLSPQTAGFILVAQPVMMVLLSPIAGRLSDRIRPQNISLAGMVFCLIGLAMMANINERTSLVFIIAGLVIIGTGFGLFSAPTSNAVMSAVTKDQLGVASGVIGTMRNGGIIFSMGIAMLLLSAFVGDNQITPQYYPLFLHTMKVNFIVASAISLVGICLQIITNVKYRQQPALTTN